MGNTHPVIWGHGLTEANPSAVFHALDVEGKGYLTLKDLLAPSSPGLIMPHSLPALYFFDELKDGRLTESEFKNLVTFCQTEKKKVEDALAHDENFRDLILRASKAGVKDCSVGCRSSFRRFSSYSNVKTVYSRKDTRTHPPNLHSNFQQYPSRTNQQYQQESYRLPDFDDQKTNDNLQHPNNQYNIPDYINTQSVSCQQVQPNSQQQIPDSPAATSSLTSDDGQTNPPQNQDDPITSCNPHLSSTLYPLQPHTELASVASTTESIDAEDVCPLLNNNNAPINYPPSTEPTDDDELDWQDPKNRTALDAAAVENIMHTNIHKLANLLHVEDSREEFMSWLWNLVDYNSSGVVTLEELEVFIDVLKEDGINPEDLVFYREYGVPLEECIINEFDTTHASMLSRDEFMVLADLVTREYEFWENRHLERIGDYELGRTIGRGSSGVVRYAVHVGTQKKFAVKIIKSGKCSTMVPIDREIKSLQMAEHPNIVGLEEVLETDDNMFIIMELCGGGSMVDIVRITPKERMLEDSARFFVRQMFEALAFCHENLICHRDVRLDNVMLDNDGNVKITDFGHSGQYTMGWDFFSTSLVGSVYNLSPEQINGELYSGERLDIWSAGVAVYCLLVGRPPFFDPDVTLLLQKIIAGQFEIPDYISAEAKDLIRCMIRVNPCERIPLHQMLHHPWFYEGSEKQPQMHVVNIPVDEYFKKRPDIAEMIMAITIYQHNLHFHLADTHNPKSSPDDHRGQDWTLKCLCPRNDIKFTVSLFTHKPTSLPKGLRRKSNFGSPPYPEIPSVNPTPVTGSPQKEVSRRTSLESFQNEGSSSSSSTFRNTRNPRVIHRRKEMMMSSRNSGKDQFERPPLLRTALKITPMGVAAHLRNNAKMNKSSQPTGDNSTTVSTGDLFDLDLDIDLSTFTVQSFNEEILQRGANESFASDPLGDASAFDPDFIPEPGRVMRINRSATVDAFPYYKVFPQRKMPESAKHLNFDTPSTPPPETVPGNTKVGEAAIEKMSERIQRGSFHRSITIHSGCSIIDSTTKKRPSGKEKEIALTLCRHPSKAVSPQSPQVRCNANGGPEGPPLGSNFQLNSPNSSSQLEEVNHEPNSLPILSEETDIRGNEECVKDDNQGEEEEEEKEDIENEQEIHSQDDEEFQPYLEVRLQGGESGLFLKICRKLKTLCSTKLAAQAERQKRRATTGGGRSLSALRHSASSRNIDPERSVTTEEEMEKES